MSASSDQLPDPQANLRIVGVFGSNKLPRDARLLADLMFFQQLLPRSGDATWISGYDVAKPEITAMITVHGHPNAERLEMSTALLSSWKKFKFKERKLQFLTAISSAVSRSSCSDRLVIIICRHSNSNGVIEMGNHRQLFTGGRHDKVIRPEDVFDLLRPTHFKGEATIIVNSCHAGVWADRARFHGLDALVNGLTVVTRCSADEELLSYPSSASNRFRGGYFCNSVGNAISNQFGVGLPRARL